MPVTYTKDKNGRWVSTVTTTNQSVVPVDGPVGFGGKKPPPKRRSAEEARPWYWHLTPQGIANDLRYEGKRVQQFNKPQPGDRPSAITANPSYVGNAHLMLGPLAKPVLQAVNSPVYKQVLAGMYAKAPADAALALVNLAQRAEQYQKKQSTYGRYVLSNDPTGGLISGILGSVFGKATDPEATPVGRQIMAARRGMTQFLGARLPEQMRPEDSLYEDNAAFLGASIATAPIGGVGPKVAARVGGPVLRKLLQAGLDPRIAKVAAGAGRWGAGLVADQAAANLITDNTQGGPSSLIKATGLPFPDALSADPKRDDRISAALRETPAAVLFAAAIGGLAGTGKAGLKKFPHIQRALRDSRAAQEMRTARATTVDNGLQVENPDTGAHEFTPAATTPPPPRPMSPLEADAAAVGVTPDQYRHWLLHGGDVTQAPGGAQSAGTAPAAAPASPAGLLPPGRDPLPLGGKVLPGPLPTGHNPAWDPWLDDAAYQAWLKQNSSNALAPIFTSDLLTPQQPPKGIPTVEAPPGSIEDPWSNRPDPNSPVQKVLGMRAGEVFAGPGGAPNPDAAAYQQWLQQNSSNALAPIYDLQPGATAQRPAPAASNNLSSWADPWATGPDPNSPVQQALGEKLGAGAEATPKAKPPEEEFYDPELPEIDHAALALQQLEPQVIAQIAATPGPVLPQIEQALASRQPVQPRPELKIADVTAPTQNLAETPSITRRAQWSALSDQALLGAFHPIVNPGLADLAEELTGRSFEELTRNDALEVLGLMADQGSTVIPQRLAGGLELARTADLRTDPRRFQYKLNTDKRGVQKGNSLEGLEQWNPDIEGIVTVWQDPKDGQLYVINGHNRVAKAQELGIPSLPVKRLLAETPEQARALGALENIGSGAGTPWDAAKFFRDAGITDAEQAGAAGLPLRSEHKMPQRGLMLAQLPSNIFEAGLTGKLPEARALELGGSGLSPEKMQAVWSEYQADADFRGKDGAAFRELIDFTRQAPTVKAGKRGRATQTTLPGFEETSRDLTKLKLRLAREVAKALETDRRALKGAARNADTLETRGNSQIDARASMQAGEETGRLGLLFNQLKYQSGPVGDLLNQGAEEIANGARLSAVARRIQGELGQAAEQLVTRPEPTPRVAEPVQAEPAAPEPPKPPTEQDMLADQLLVLNRAAAQGEVRPSATPIPEPPAPPEVSLPKEKPGINAEDVATSEDALKLAKQQAQAAKEAGDAAGEKAWNAEIRRINKARLAAEEARKAATQTGLFGVEEFDNTMPLFDQSKLDAEEARLAEEYRQRDIATQQEMARAERAASGYDEKTFDQKVAEHGIGDGWELPDAAPPAEPAAPPSPRPLQEQEQRLSQVRDVLLPQLTQQRDLMAAQGKSTALVDKMLDEVQKLIKESEQDIKAIKEGSGSGQMNRIRNSTGYPDVDPGGGQIPDRLKKVLKLQLEEEINRIAGDDVVVRFKDAYPLVERGPEWGGGPGNMAPQLGFYLPGDGFISDIMQINGIGSFGGLVDAWKTLYHEAWHRIQFVALGEKESRVMNSVWARFKMAIAAGHFPEPGGISYIETQAVAIENYVYAKHAQQDPVSYVLRQYGVFDNGIISDLARQFLSGVDKVLDFAEKVHNAFAGNGFISTKSVIEDFYKGNLIAKYDQSFAPLNQWEKLTWDYNKIGAPSAAAASANTINRIDRAAALSSVLREADDGRFKGASKQALKLAEVGKPDQWLRELTDYATRRSAQLDAEIESIKQRAILEGC